ncbi:hypothetical protein BU52_02185 [Streptomyces toyocaensis]|uniref:Uncharacterized protein n=1 Tax=Streptomyces toyocaensis TaxID=55952 RepID=A0A081XZA7_STRTO|nr:hypothetical protein [Streptomyces toyocaensis]KES08880.1 hypothetical protein BU52_02185 [Streptomyces toyocaensis]
MRSWDADGRTTHAGYVESGGNADDFLRLSGATGDVEQNAVTAPDGRCVWFTYITADGERRIGSHGLLQGPRVRGHWAVLRSAT